MEEEDNSMEEEYNSMEGEYRKIIQVAEDDVYPENKIPVMQLLFGRHCQVHQC